MAKNWFSSDHHFGHDAIRKYADRPFKSVAEMDTEMMRRWNSTVEPQDFVYYLGDLALIGRDETRKILSMMNGIFFYVRGNHDKQLKGSVCDRFQWIKDYYRLKVQPQSGGKPIPIVLCHYPFETWNQSHYGVWHLHGHCHGSLKTARSGRLDIGVDSHDFLPWSLEELVEHFANEEVTEDVDHHGRKVDGITG